MLLVITANGHVRATIQWDCDKKSRTVLELFDVYIT